MVEKLLLVWPEIRGSRSTAKVASRHLRRTFAGKRAGDQNLRSAEFDCTKSHRTFLFPKQVAKSSASGGPPICWTAPKSKELVNRLTPVHSHQDPEERGDKTKWRAFDLRHFWRRRQSGRLEGRKIVIQKQGIAHRTA